MTPPTRPLPDPRRGAILVLVLVALAGVAVLGALLFREVGVNYASSSSVKATLTASAVLDSGMLLAADVLMMDKRAGSADHLQEQWNHFDEVAERLGQDMGGVELTGTIEDENGRFPLNALTTGDENTNKFYGQIFIRLVNGLANLHGMRVNPGPLIENLRHWQTDPDKETVPEDGWYAAQDPPYRRTGSPLHTPGELLLVRWPGVPEDAFERLVLGNGDIPGLRDVATTFGSGPINMNTALPAVVMAVCPTAGRAEAFLDAVQSYRSNPGNPLNSDWHEKVAYGVGVDISLYPKPCLGQASEVFRIDLKATMGAAARRHRAVVRVSAKKCAILWQQAR